MFRRAELSNMAWIRYGMRYEVQYQRHCEYDLEAVQNCGGSLPVLAHARHVVVVVVVAVHFLSETQQQRSRQTIKF